jgi:hypothetical protein
MVHVTSRIGLDEDEEEGAQGPGVVPGEPGPLLTAEAGSHLLAREAEDWRRRAHLAEGALGLASAILCCDAARVPAAADRAVAQGDALGHELARAVDELDTAREARDIAREELANSRATTDYLIGRVDALSAAADKRFTQVESMLVDALAERDRLRAEVDVLRADHEREVRRAEERGAFWGITELPHAGRPGMRPEERAIAAAAAGRARARLGA